MTGQMLVVSVAVVALAAVMLWSADLSRLSKVLLGALIVCQGVALVTDRWWLTVAELVGLLCVVVGVGRDERVRCEEDEELCR
jgi:hypothetical protein